MCCWHRYTVGNCCVVSGEPKHHTESPVLRSGVLIGFRMFWEVSGTELVVGHGKTF